MAPVLGQLILGETLVFISQVQVRRHRALSGQMSEMDFVA